MAKADFEHLPVYHLAEKLADEVWDIVISWDAFARETVGRRLARSADRIARHIAVGAGHEQVQDKKRFLLATRRALDEARHWLRRAYRRGLLTKEQIERLRPTLEALTESLHATPRAVAPPRPTPRRPWRPPPSPRTARTAPRTAKAPGVAPDEPAPEPTIDGPDTTEIEGATETEEADDLEATAQTKATEAPEPHEPTPEDSPPGPPDDRTHDPG